MQLTSLGPVHYPLEQKTNEPIAQYPALRSGTADRDEGGMGVSCAAAQGKKHPHCGRTGAGHRIRSGNQSIPLTVALRRHGIRRK